jgi:hypothetical protein
MCRSLCPAKPQKISHRKSACPQVGLSLLCLTKKCIPVVTPWSNIYKYNHYPLTHCKISSTNFITCLNILKFKSIITVGGNMSTPFNILHKIHTSLIKKGYKILSKCSPIKFKISEVDRKAQLSGFQSC